MKPRLLAFDWDGTLIDSITTIIDCTLETFRHIGRVEPSRQRVRAAIGLGLRESVELFYPGTDDALFKRVIETYRELWIGSYTQRSELFDGIPEMLADLRDQGHWLAVATAKGRAGLERELSRTGIGDLFSETRTVDECPPKPDPGMLLDLMAVSGLPAERALMVGDTTWDMEMARNAGVRGVAVVTGAHDREQLRQADPAVCLESLTAFPLWLENGAGDGGAAG